MLLYEKHTVYQKAHNDKRQLSVFELIYTIVGRRYQDRIDMLLSDHPINTLRTLELSTFEQYFPKGTAMKLFGALELGRRIIQMEQDNSLPITSSQQAYRNLIPYFLDLEHEEIYMLALNRGNRIKQVFHISKGGVSGTVCDAKIIFSKLLAVKASGFILAHNHPSGQTKPSEQDRQLTSKIYAGGKLLDVHLYDHLIITNQGYYSFADEGELP